MKTFKDKEGSEWKVDITLGTLHELDTSIDWAGTEAEKQEMNFLRPDERLFITILTDSIVAGAIGWCIVREQAEKRQITKDVDFYKLLDAPSIEKMQTVILEEMAHLFPHLRTAILPLIRKYSRMAEIAREEVTTILEGISDNDIRKMLKGKSKELKAEVDEFLVTAPPGQ